MKEAPRQRMKKVMISQPMRGKTQEQIRSERADLVKTLTEQGYEVIDTVFAESPEEAASKPVWYLAKSLEAISKIDYLYFMDGWQDARGCRIEHQVCDEYGIKIIKY